MSASTFTAPLRPATVGEGAPPALAWVLELLGSVFERANAGGSARAAELAEDVRLRTPATAGLPESLEALAHAYGGGLEVEYVRLFLHGRPVAAHPYESFYRAGRLMDPDCLGELDALFASAGVMPHDDDAVHRDHIAVELQFLALLLRGLATSEPGGAGAGALRAVAAEMLDAHLLPFARAFCARLGDLHPAPYFRAAAAALGPALAATRDALAPDSDPTRLT